MFQQIIAIFVLKTSAGFSIFSWIAYLAKDFLEQAYKGSAFFFSDEIVSKHYFFVNTLGAIIFFIAFVQMMYYVSARLHPHSLRHIADCEMVPLPLS